MLTAGGSYKENTGPGHREEERREEAEGARGEGPLHHLIMPMTLAFLLPLSSDRIIPCYSGEGSQSARTRQELHPVGHGAHRHGGHVP